MSLGVVAIVGVTGAVGREALKILESRGHPASRIVALASARSAGTTVPYAGGSLAVREISAEAFAGVSAAIFCADADTARKWTPVAVEAGSLVVDNSSAFRMSPDVPLVIPEVNGELVRGVPSAGVSAKTANGSARRAKVIANPNCTTIILLTALNPLRRSFGVERIVVSTYQAVSGAGAAAIDELNEQARAVLAGGEARPSVFKEPCAFNVFSHDSAMDAESGLNGEELKVIAETRKIWGDESVAVSPTCVRVPVVRAHTESITVTFSRPASETEVRAALESGAGLRIIDDRSANSFPTPLKASGGDDILVGRIRRDPSVPADADGRSRGWCLLVSGDQLRKGAALNAVQIAELAAAG